VITNVFVEVSIVLYSVEGMHIEYDGIVS
jgi:hypothetical protein